MRTSALRRPRNRVETLAYIGPWQHPLPLELEPVVAAPPAWDRYWRRCLTFKRCGEVLPDGWRCRTRVKVGSDRCTLHHGETP